MSKVITFSRNFQKSHSSAGEPTYFVEKIYQGIWQQISYRLICDLNEALPISILWEFWNSLNQEDYYNKKNHTIRAGHRFKAGDSFSPRVWSGKPYCSKQIIISSDIKIKKVWDFKLKPSLWWDECEFYINGNWCNSEKLVEVAKNDGLEITDFLRWFLGNNSADTKRKPFDGQIICWNDKIEY